MHEPPNPATGEPTDPDPEAVARLICLRLLDQRARSRAELAQALASRGVPDESAAAVLDRFAEVGLIDDAALASSLAAAQHRDRGLARRAIAQKLRTRGLTDELDVALAQIDGEAERERARQLVERKARTVSGLPVQVQYRRLVGLLGRKGYPPGVVHDVVREALAQQSNADVEPEPTEHDLT